MISFDRSSFLQQQPGWRADRLEPSVICPLQSLFFLSLARLFALTGSRRGPGGFARCAVPRREPHAFSAQGSERPRCYSPALTRHFQPRPGNAGLQFAGSAAQLLPGGSAEQRASGGVREQRGSTSPGWSEQGLGARGRVGVSASPAWGGHILLPETLPGCSPPSPPASGPSTCSPRPPPAPGT